MKSYQQLKATHDRDDVAYVMCPMAAESCTWMCKRFPAKPIEYHGTINATKMSRTEKSSLWDTVLLPLRDFFQGLHETPSQTESPELGRDGQRCHVSMPVFALAFSLAHDCRGQKSFFFFDDRHQKFSTASYRCVSQKEVDLSTMSRIPICLEWPITYSKVKMKVCVKHARLLRERSEVLTVSHYLSTRRFRNFEVFRPVRQILHVKWQSILRLWQKTLTQLFLFEMEVSLSLLFFFQGQNLPTRALISVEVTRFSKQVSHSSEAPCWSCDNFMQSSVLIFATRCSTENNEGCHIVSWGQCYWPFAQAKRDSYMMTTTTRT